MQDLNKAWLSHKTQDAINALPTVDAVVVIDELTIRDFCPLPPPPTCHHAGIGPISISIMVCKALLRSQ